jgi:hypothetical protein
MTYLQLNTDGTMERINRKTPLSLRERQTIVGGYVENQKRIGFTLQFNEDGLELDLEPNSFFPDLVGPIIVGKTIGNQRTLFKFTGLSPDEVQTVETLLTERDRIIDNMIDEMISATAIMHGITCTEAKNKLTGSQLAYLNWSAATAFDEGRTSILARG